MKVEKSMSLNKFLYRLLIILVLLLAFQLLHAENHELPGYVLDIKLDLENERLSGLVSITLPASAIEGGAVRLNVETSGDTTMGLIAITGLSGRQLSYVGPDSSGVITIQLDNNQPEIIVDYSFRVDSTWLEQFGYYPFARFGSGWYAYPQIEKPNGEYFHFADFKVTFDYPSSLAVLTTGGEGMPQSSGGRTVAQYEAAHVEDFAMVAGDGFVVKRYEEGGVAVVAFYHPDYAVKFAKVVEYTKEAAAWYNRTYGFFPMEQVGIIQGHPNWGGGYPLPNLFGIHLGNLKDQHLTWISAHELGHYYWGLYVLGEGGRLTWLQLALGIWSDQLYLAERKGITLPQQWRDAIGQGDWIVDYFQAMVSNYEQQLGIPRAEFKKLDFDYNSLVRHGKGAVGVYLQSLLIGRDRFLKLQKQILTDYKHRVLPEEEFFDLITDAGAVGAHEFFKAWKQGDATIRVTVDDIEPDPDSGGWRVNLRRTGSVPYPVEIELLSSGDTIKYTMPADRDRDTLRVSALPEKVRLDPNGIVPMWNSSHPGIRSAYLRALDRAQQHDLFLILARDLLDETPDDDHLRYRLIRRLYWVTEWVEAAALFPQTKQCESRYDCYAAIYAARALSKLDRSEEAQTRLTNLKEKAEQFEVASFWQRVWDDTDH